MRIDSTFMKRRSPGSNARTERVIGRRDQCRTALARTSRSSAARPSGGSTNSAYAPMRSLTRRFRRPTGSPRQSDSRCTLCVTRLGRCSPTPTRRRHWYAVRRRDDVARASSAIRPLATQVVGVRAASVASNTCDRDDLGLVTTAHVHCDAGTVPGRWRGTSLQVRTHTLGSRIAWIAADIRRSRALCAAQARRR